MAKAKKNKCSGWDQIGKLVYVEWLDSRQPISEWQFLDDYAETSAVKCKTVGWLISDGEVYSIAQNIGDDESEDKQVSGVMRIPRCAIKNIEFINVH